LADSRLLDDVEELLIPAAIAIGGLYALWWVGRTIDTAIESVPGAVSSIIDYDLPFVGEGDFIDRWTLNPQEVMSMAGRARDRRNALIQRAADGVGTAGAKILRWRPW